MKQSTKLLSLVLALVMAFSCMSVIGNAALVKGNIKYDSVDDAVLTPEDVADIALDLVDGLLAAGGDDMNIVLIKNTLELDFRTVDKALASLCEHGIGTIGTLGPIAGDAKELNFTAFSPTGKKNNPYQRSHGDMVVVRQLLKFIYDNANLLSRIVYGIGQKNGIDLGSLLNGIIGDSLDDINAIVMNLDKFAISMVYDLLIHGSYKTGYENDSFPASDELSALPGEVDTLSEIIDYAIAGLLTNPQDYEWVDTDNDGLTDKKVWDPNSKLLPSAAALGFSYIADYLSVAGTDFDANNGVAAKQHTIFEILDKAAPFAIYDLAIPALNHNLKKGLMEAVDADLNIIDKELVPADVMKVFADESKYVTYIGYDCMAKDKATGDWYYTTLENVLVTDANGNPVLDKDGNEQTKRERVYYKVNLAAANEFGSLINWDWNLYAPEPNKGDNTIDDINELNYDALITKYGSITESLNDIVGIVYKNALKKEVRDDFEEQTEDTWVEGETSKVFTNNVERLLKYLLANFGGKIFGEDSPYADEDVYNYDFYEPMSLVDIVALIGPSFFEDVMPQLIIPKNDDGTYAFATSEGGESVAFLQFGALVIREFMTEITPNVNYDAYIFAEGSLTDGSGRQFADNEAEEWFNIILNMGLDIAYTYLGQITNFGDTIKYNDAGTALATFTARSTDYLATPPADRDAATTEGRWKGMLNDIIDWAVSYVGQGNYSVLKGFEPDTFAAKFKENNDPLDKLSYILNTLLPLGFINGLEDGTYDASVSILFDRLKSLLTTLDLNELVALFGRNGVGDDDSTLVRGNILNMPLQKMVINLVTDILKLVLGKNIFASASSEEGKKTPPTTLDGLLPKEALKGTVQNLLTSLYESEQRGLIKAALPVVGKLIKGWGSEQELKSPDIDISSHLKLTNGATTEAQEVVVTNDANGVWSSWIDASGNRQTAESLYQIKLVGVEAYKLDGTALSTNNFSPANLDTKNYIGQGKKSTFNYSISNMGANEYIRVDVKYQVYEGETAMTNETYVASNFVYLDNSVTDAGQRQNVVDNDGYVAGVKSPHYFDLNEGMTLAKLQGINGAYMERGDVNRRSYNLAITGTAAVGGIKAGSGTAYGGDYFGTNNTRYFSDIYPFQNDVEWTSTGDKKDRYLKLTGASFDKNAWDAMEYKSGDTSNIPVRFTGENKKYNAGRVRWDTSATFDATGNIIIKYYDGAAREDLARAVEKAVNTDRRAEYYTDSAAWTTYVNALNAAADAAYTEFRINGNFDYKGTQAKLEAATSALENSKKADSRPALTSSIAALKAQLDSVEATYTDEYDYTDYKMHRLNRLNDARDEARWLIDLHKDASRKMADIDSNFPYNGMVEADLKAVVAANSALNIVAGTDGKNIVEALLEDLSEEEYKDRANWLVDRYIEYAGVTTFDVFNASDMLTEDSSRLLNRSYKVNGNPDFTMINTEIASAEAEIDADNLDEDGNKIYTDRSWAKYTAALQDAKNVVSGNGRVKSQKNAFDAKWELLCCRNELVLVDDEADYTELETLIAQAEQVMANLSLYDNSAKELGQVLAELGVKGTIVNENGDPIDIFPGSAYHVNAEPYAEKDQDKIDGKARELKEALARLKFKGLNITGSTVADKVIVAPNEEEGIEAVYAKVATIAAEMDAGAVKEFFAFTADNAKFDKENITVSNDLNYTVETKLGNGFAGTNSVVTFYTVQGGIKIPVATVRLVVNGDINGDGVVDVIDGANAFLVSTDKAALDGCYFIAGNLVGEAEVGKGVIDADDYSALINLVVA